MAMNYYNFLVFVNLFCVKFINIELVPVETQAF